MDLLEPFIAFRRVLLQVLRSKDCMVQHLLQSASTLRKVHYTIPSGSCNFWFNFLIYSFVIFRDLDILKQLLPYMSLSLSVFEKQMRTQHCIGLEGYTTFIPLQCGWTWQYLIFCSIMCMILKWLWFSFPGIQKRY